MNEPNELLDNLDNYVTNEQMNDKRFLYHMVFAKKETVFVAYLIMV